MIPEVKPGERISAQKQNDIIKACNGLQTPADSYVNTPSGTLFPTPVPSFNNMQSRCVETMFQLKFGLKQMLSARESDDSGTLSDYYTLSSVQYGYSIDLGNDFGKLKDQVDLMYKGVDDIFTVGKNGGTTLSVHLVADKQLQDGSDESGFFDLGCYWKAPGNGCSLIQAEKLELSSDNPQAQLKKAFVIAGSGYMTRESVMGYYKNKYPGEWKVTESSKATIGYLHDQRLVQTRLGLLFPETINEYVDSELTSLHLSSIQERLHTIDDKDIEYHQMFHFEAPCLSDFALSDQSDCDIVIRDYKYDRVPDGAAVNYVKVHDFLSATRYDVDTDATQGDERSLVVIPHGVDIKRDYLQLYHFSNPWVDIDSEMLQCRIAYGETRYVVRPGEDSYYPDDYLQFVCRHTATGKTKLVYDGIKIIAPEIHAGDVVDLSSVISDYVIHTCTCNMEELSADLLELSGKVDDLSSELSDRWKVGGSYNDNCYGESIGDTSMTPQIHLDWGQLLYSNENDPTVDWHNGYLQWNNGETRIDWPSCVLYDTNIIPAITWDSRTLLDSSVNPTLDWEHGVLYTNAGGLAGDWSRRQLWDGTHPTVEWGDYRLNGPSGNESVNWWECKLWDSNHDLAVDWGTRTLSGGWYVTNGALTIDGNYGIYIGNVWLDESTLSAIIALVGQAPSMLSSL